MEIKTKKNYHFIRKLGHMLPGLLLVILMELNLFSNNTLSIFFSKIFIIILILEFLRLRIEVLNKVFIFLFHKFIRKKEINEYSGVLTYLLGIIFVLSFFDQKIASLSILYLSFGDPFAALSGLFFSNRDKNFKIFKDKTIMGFFGMVSICTVITILYLSLLYNFPIQNTFFVGFFAGSLAAIAETFLSEKIDDNLLIPLISSVALYFLFFSF